MKELQEKVKAILSEIENNFKDEKDIEFAKTNLPAQKYFWEDAELEEMIKHITGDVSASYYPSPELVVFKDAQQLPVLSYRMELSASIPLFSYEVFISAMDVLLFRQAKLI